MAEAHLTRWLSATPRRRRLTKLAIYVALVVLVLLGAHLATKWRAYGFLICMDRENSRDNPWSVRSPIFMELAARTLNESRSHSGRHISAASLSRQVRFNRRYPYIDIIYESNDYRDAQEAITALIEAYVFVFPPDLPGNERPEDTALLESLATTAADRQVLAVRRKYAAIPVSEAQSEDFDSGPLILRHFSRIDPIIIAWVWSLGALGALAAFGLTVSIRSARRGSGRTSKVVRFLTQRRAVYVMIAGAIVVVGLFLLGWVTGEARYEFDIVNLRMRYCEANIYSEHCGDPVDHLTGRELRKLGILEPVSEEDARWELIKGFKMGVRGWMGSGRNYVTALGAHTWLTPVTLPAGEDVSKNLWVRWALSDPAGAKQFWKTQRSLAQKEPWLSGERVAVAQRILEAHDANVSLEKLNAEIRQYLPELGEVETH